MHLNDSREPDLSIVIPAYNEASRLPGTLDRIDRYLEDSGLVGEVIVANDGSTDATGAIAARRSSRTCQFRVLNLPHRGKANAVRAGVLSATGRIILFSDADLSTPIGHADELMRAIELGASVAIGSREGIGALRVGEPGYRHIMGRVFNLIVRLLAVPGIDDTQCGFKAFRREVAHDLFQRVRLHVGEGDVRGPRVTGFDVEVLYLARRSGYSIVEIPVSWVHVPGSKVRPLHDAVRMFADVARVRLNALRGRYDEIPPSVPKEGAN